MPSSVTGHKFGSEQLIPGFMNSAMWSYGMMPPWHQSVPAQQFAYPMPFPVVMPQLSAQHQWFAAPNTTPMENFTSLPPKAKQDNEAPPIPEAVKLTRRHSDPGPFAADKLSNKKKQADANDLRSSSPLEDDCDYSETQLFAGKNNCQFFTYLNLCFIIFFFIGLLAQQRKQIGIKFSAAYCKS